MKSTWNAFGYDACARCVRHRVLGQALALAAAGFGLLACATTPAGSLTATPSAHIPVHVPQATTTPLAPTGAQGNHASGSDVAAAIDTFEVSAENAHWVWARLIAREEKCDTYCWARIEVLHDRRHGRLRVAYRTAGAGIPAGISNLFLAPYQKAYPESKLWRLVNDAHDPRVREKPSRGQVIDRWAHVVQSGDAELLKELTAFTFNFREMRAQRPVRVVSGASRRGTYADACSKTIGTPEELRAWLDCLLHSNNSDTLALGFSFGEVAVHTGMETAPPSLRSQSGKVGGTGSWAHVALGDKDLRIDMLLRLREGMPWAKVDGGLMKSGWPKHRTCRREMHSLVTRQGDGASSRQGPITRDPGPMTLAIHWPHPPGENIDPWPHVPGDRHPTH